MLCGFWEHAEQSLYTLTGFRTKYSQGLFDFHNVCPTFQSPIIYLSSHVNVSSGLENHGRQHSPQSQIMAHPLALQTSYKRYATPGYRLKLPYLRRERTSAQGQIRLPQH